MSVTMNITIDHFFNLCGLSGTNIWTLCLFCTYFYVAWTADYRLTVLNFGHYGWLSCTTAAHGDFRLALSFFQLIVKCTVLKKNWSRTLFWNWFSKPKYWILKKVAKMQTTKFYWATLTLEIWSIVYWDKKLKPNCFEIRSVNRNKEIQSINKNVNNPMKALRLLSFSQRDKMRGKEGGNMRYTKVTTKNPYQLNNEKQIYHKKKLINYHRRT